MRPWWLAGLLFIASPCLAAPPAGPLPGTDPAARAQLHWIPEDTPGGTAMLLTRICRPADDAAAHIMVLSHGRAPTAAGRQALKPVSCGNQAVRWFTARGYLVIAPVRPGYGETGGADAEAAACTPQRDYAATALVAARAITAALRYAEALPNTRKDGVLLVGQSAGGLATVAYAAHPGPEVAGVINMAGGNGGHMHGRDNDNCRPDLLAAAMAQFGATSPLPELWVYAANDSYFAPAIATAMHTAFTGAGGRAELWQPGPFGHDGHTLFFARGGAAVWGEMVGKYLATTGK